MRPSFALGAGATSQLPITDDLYREAEHRSVQGRRAADSRACDLLAAADARSVAAILHVTC